MTAAVHKFASGPDALDVGARVLAGLALGRERSLEVRRRTAAQHRLVVLAAARGDEQRGHGPRGRAGRIAQRLRGLLSRRQVQRILDAQEQASSSPT
jgi:hypothetical protein